jgi:hypothetical protein
MRIESDGYAFDIELLKVVDNKETQPYFCVCFERIGERHVFEISKRKNDYYELVSFLKQNPLVLAGYNSTRYDLPILSFIYNEGSNISWQDLLYQAIKISNKIIKDDVDFSNLVELPSSLIAIDLQSLTFQHKNRKSLKTVGVILGHSTVSDIPLNPETGLGMEEYDANVIYDSIIKYCFNDTSITYLLYQKSKDKLILRLDTMNKYPDTDLLSAYDSTMSQILMVKEYSRISGIDENELKWMKSPLNSIKIKDVVEQDFLDSLFFTEKTRKKLNDFLNLIVDFTKDDDKSSSKVKIFTKTIAHDLGAGGIHSVQSGGKRYISDNQYYYIDFDFSSFYPYLMRVFKIAPKHLDTDIFINLISDWIDNRIKYKSLFKKTFDIQYETFANRLKIFLNAIYGLLGLSSYFLYDPAARLKICVYGQLILLSMIEKSETIKGVECIYSNTDGMMFKCPSNKIKEFHSLLDQLANQVKIPAEYNYVSRAIIRDVNNYIIELGEIKDWSSDIRTVDLKRKMKGAFSYTPDLLKSMSCPIIAKGLEAYFLDNKPVEDFIINHTNPLDFCMSRKFSKDANLILTNINDNGEIVDTDLSSTLRWYYSTSQSKIKKHDKYLGKERISDLAAKNKIALLLDYDSNIPMSNYNIDYNYYINQVKSQIHPIENVITLF